MKVITFPSFAWRKCFPLRKVRWRVEATFFNTLFFYNSCVEEYGKRILATWSLRGQLLANLHVLIAAKVRLANRTEWGEAITVPYGAVIMIEDTHKGK